MAKEARIIARTTKQGKELIQEAAELSGVTLTNFMINAATDKAREVIDSYTRIQLTKDAAEKVFAAIDQAQEADK